MYAFGGLGLVLLNENDSVTRTELSVSPFRSVRHTFGENDSRVAREIDSAELSARRRLTRAGREHGG